MWKGYWSIKKERKDDQFYVVIKTSTTTSANFSMWIDLNIYPSFKSHEEDLITRFDTEPTWIEVDNTTNKLLNTTWLKFDIFMNKMNEYTFCAERYLPSWMT
jgi:hypothetical protein